VPLIAIFYKCKCISANADGPRDAASCPIDHISLHTVSELNAEYSPGDKRRDVDSTLLYTDRDRQLSVVSTYVHSEAETPLVPFVVDVFYRQIRNKSTTNGTSGV